MFTGAEYRRRLDVTREEMRERGIEVAIVDQLEHVAYLTGYAPRGTRYQPCVVPLEADPIVFFRTVERTTFRDQSWLPDGVAVSDVEDPFRVLVGVLRDHRWASARIGVELDSNFLPVSYYHALAAALPDATLVDFGGALREMRLRKSPEELAVMRRAGQICAAMLGAALDVIRAGVAKGDALVALYQAGLSRGADSARLGMITLEGRTRDSQPDAWKIRFGEGDVLNVDLIPTVGGYTARMIRQVSIGEPSGALADSVARLVALQDAQIAAMRPGARAADIDAIARDRLLESGFGAIADNVTGYTIGYIPGSGTPRTSDYARVFLPSADWELEEGMTFHMSLHGQIAISDSVVVTADGCERLTKSPRQLFVR